MELFEVLKKKQRFTDFNSSKEYRFFLDNVGTLQKVGFFSRFVKAEDPFEVIRANIIIRAIQNKETLDQIYSGLHRSLKKDEKASALEAATKRIEDVRKDLPYIKEGNNRIFIPILPRAVNAIYSGDIWKLEEKPYKSLIGEAVYDALICDPFDTYGDAVFNSRFTNLIPLGKNEQTAAFYSYDSVTVYFVNRKQGRLEVELCLFDRGITRRYFNHMIERLTPVVNDYLSGDKESMKKHLVENQLVSSKLIFKNSSDENMAFLRFSQKAE